MHSAYYTAKKNPVLLGIKSYTRHHVGDQVSTTIYAKHHCTSQKEIWRKFASLQIQLNYPKNANKISLVPRPAN